MFKSEGKYAAKIINDTTKGYVKILSCVKKLLQGCNITVFCLILHLFFLKQKIHSYNFFLNKIYYRLEIEIFIHF
jgi:hypothetical protein